MAGRLDALDDPDYPAYTTGRAAEVLGVRQAFLRSLDAAGAVTPQRTPGGRRRYSRRQLAFVRIRELLDQGHTIPSPPRDGSWPWKTTWPPSARDRPPARTARGAGRDQLTRGGRGH